MLAVLPIVAAFPAPRPPSSALLTRRSALGLTTSAAASAVFPAQPCLALSDDAAEPEAARKLLELVEGRRPSSWRNEERALVDSLIEEVVALNAPWPRGALIGKWKLAYLQPGPDGTGVDRRVPFPEFDFNDSWQIFGVDSLVNVGELLGPALEVRVSGQLSEDDTSVVTPTPESNRLGSGSFSSNGQRLLDSRGSRWPLRSASVRTSRAARSALEAVASLRLASTRSEGFAHRCPSRASGSSMGSTLAGGCASARI